MEFQGWGFQSNSWDPSFFPTSKVLGAAWNIFNFPEVLLVRFPRGPINHLIANKQRSVLSILSDSSSSLFVVSSFGALKQILTSSNNC